ncbi:MAG: MFS transporter [Actinomycetota bacterium]|nr:MFS transporter [Actinomycetota bacterium]
MLARVTAPIDSYRALLRRQGYSSFVATVLFSRLTGTMFNVSGVLLVLERTGSAPLAGITSAAAVLPGALTGPVLGAWLDVARCRRVLVVADQLLSAGALAGLVALAGDAPQWTLPAMAFFYSVTRPFSAGTFTSALAEIVGVELLGTASAIEASSLNLAFIVGPGLAGALAGAYGAGAVVLLQAGLTVVVAFLIAMNPVFETRPAERAEGVSHALRDGLRALAHDRVLRATNSATMLATLGWGFMVVGFPLYAARTLHAGAHAGGYLWGALAAGSILGTVAISGARSLGRVAVSYLALGLSALAWPLAHSLGLGIALVGLTGFLEGPAFSGTIAIRQRQAPAAVRAQVLTTMMSLGLVASALGAVVGGAIHTPEASVIAFTAVNTLAALIAFRASRAGASAPTSKPPPTPEPPPPAQ